MMRAQNASEWPSSEAGWSVEDVLIAGLLNASASQPQHDPMADNASLVNATLEAPASRSPSVAQISFVSYCIVLPVIAVLGIIGNIANLITLASPRLRQVSYMYLRALAVADLVCMISVLVFTTIQTVYHFKLSALDSYLAVFYQAHMMLTLINTSITAGILIVVALTVERYISVCFPILFRQWNSPRRATMAIAAAYAIPTVLYIPYACFRYEVVHVGNSSNSTADRYMKTDSHWVNSRYKAYEAARELTLKIVPIVVLSVLNVQIMVAFRRRIQNRQRLKNSNRTTTSHSTANIAANAHNNPTANASSSSMRNAINRLSKTDSNKTEDKTASVKDRNAQRDDALLFLLAAIVLMFFICNIPAATNMYLITEQMKKEVLYALFRACANLLEIANHALNFYVFCMCSSEYRTTFVEKFPAVHRTYRHLRRARRRLLAQLCGRGGGGSTQQQQQQQTHDTAETADSTGQAHQAVEPGPPPYRAHAAAVVDDSSSEMTVPRTSCSRLTNHPPDDAREPGEQDKLLAGSTDTFSASNIIGDIQFIGDSDDDTML